MIVFAYVSSIVFVYFFIFLSLLDLFNKKEIQAFERCDSNVRQNSNDRGQINS